ncbi:serine/threonine-protein kinase [Streptomyces sp. NPDC051976]|uniref:serine/threonine-protein kinase n=1 Tax=Streptomyces sp. NPDC051976 TaxID=3154947 RepID=UPI0034154E12
MERIGSYTIVRKLGEGGMGTVYLARSRGGRQVAVKVVRQGLAEDPDFRGRFRAEVAAARTVGGFHTAPVVDADPDADEPWLATAYVPGPTLGQLLTEEGPMGEARLCGLGAALAEALMAIHGCGLVHRDLKPGNIIMADDGPRVLDFGIARAVEDARLTATGTAFGTPGFLAPEQAEGRDVDGAADVFALGAVLVAAAGGSAFGGGTPVALMYRSVHQEADLTAVPDAVRPMVAACLEKDPARRPSTEELLDWFSARAENEAASAGAESGGAGAGGAAGAGSGAVSSGQAPAVYAPPPGLAPSPYAPSSPYPASPYPPLPHVRSAPLTPPAYGAPSPAVPARPAYAPAVSAPAPAPPGADAPPAPQDAAPSDEPEFLAMDGKNAVLADADGISLGKNGRTTELSWDRVVFAECVRESQRGLSVLRVDVVLPDGSVSTGRVSTRYPAELEAWIWHFNAVLIRYARFAGRP